MAKEGVFVDLETGETKVRDGDSFKPSGPLEFAKTKKGEQAKAALKDIERRRGTAKKREANRILQEQAARLQAEKLAQQRIDDEKRKIQQAKEAKQQQKIAESVKVIKEQKDFIRESRKTSVSVQTGQKVSAALKAASKEAETKQSRADSAPRGQGSFNFGRAVSVKLGQESMDRNVVVEKFIKDFKSVNKPITNTKFERKVANFETGFVKGVATEAVQRPVLTAATFAVGGGAGAALRIVKASKFAKTALVRFSVASTQIGLVGATAGSAVAAVKTKDIRDTKAIGEITGRSTLQTVAFIKGSQVGGKASGFFVDKIKVTAPLRKIRTPQFREFKRTIIDKGKLRVESEFVIVSETRPPISIDVTTPFRRKTKSAPISRRVKPAQVQITKTIEPAINQEPFKVITFKPGAKTAKITQVSGVSESAPINKISRFPKTLQLTTKKLLEIRTGRTASPTTTRKTLKSPKEVELSRIETEDLLKFRKNKGNFELIPRGRRIKETVATSRTRPVLESEKIEIIKVETQFKDITKPFARATGRSPRMEGTVTSLKEPVVAGIDKPTVIKSALEKKTPFPTNDQVSAALQKTPQLPKPIPKSASTPKTIITREVTPSTSVFGSASQFQGTGQYELTSETISQAPNIRSLSKENVQSAVSANAIASQIKVSQVTKGVTKQKGLEKLQEKVLVKQSPKIKQVTKQSSKQRQKLSLKLALKQIPKPPTPKTPGLPRFPRKTSRIIGLGGRKKRLRKAPTKRFLVEVRRKGVFQAVGRRETAAGAARLLQRTLGGTLAASGRVTGGRVPTLAGLRVPKQKSPLRKQGQVFVERRGLRLSQAGEVKAIQAARKRRRKK